MINATDFDFCRLVLRLVNVDLTRVSQFQAGDSFD